MRLEYFQLIDRIIELDLDARTVKALAQIPQTSTIFEGHFPGHPLMPGVLLIESMAQTSGWLIMGLTKFERMPFLASVREAKLRTFVSPGQTLALTARIIHEGSGFTITKAAVAVNGKTVADSEITFRVMAFPDPKFRDGMKLVAAAIGFPPMANG
ncbi:MAG TPA: 3-hydroxyacyl-ACP dehydratase FabZ family protein [Xanthobacteraceae bacterium]|nr:3-hydroxyacyl-ACP dehydratase FabZ family protein [Xanthobacteraceae bacterium]